MDFLAIVVQIPEKSGSYHASIQCWAIISSPAKREMAFRWRADDGPLKGVFGFSLPSSKKKNVVKVGPPLTKFTGSAHVIAVHWSYPVVEIKLNAFNNAFKDPL